MRIVSVEVVVIHDHHQRVDVVVIVRHLDGDVLVFEVVTFPIEDRLKCRCKTRNQLPIRRVSINRDRRHRSIQRTNVGICRWWRRRGFGRRRSLGRGWSLGRCCSQSRGRRRWCLSRGRFFCVRGAGRGNQCHDEHDHEPSALGPHVILLFGRFPTRMAAVISHADNVRSEEAGWERTTARIQHPSGRSQIAVRTSICDLWP